MNIHDKINMKDNPFCYLEFNQYMDVLKRKLIALVPYYKERVFKQSKIKIEYMYGKTRYEYENNL